MSTPNTSARQDADRVLIAAITKHLSTTASVMVNGTSYAPSQIAALLQAEIDATDAVGPAHAAWSASILVQRAATDKVTAIKSALRSFVVNMFGKTSSVLADFGYTKQAQKPSPAIQAEAVDKRAATREARHTMGKRQKAKISGAVPQVAPVQSPGNPPKA